MIIVAFSGLDGSGKSTQKELLASSLRERGLSVVDYHAVSHSFAGLIRRQFKKNTAEKNSSVSQASAVTRILRYALFPLDVLIFWVMYFFWFLGGTQYVLTDRFFIDRIINMAFLSKASPSAYFLKICPRAHQHFYINLSPKTILRRSPELEQTEKQLREKKAIYDVLSESEFTRVDGRGQQAAIAKKILAHIGLAH